MSKRYYKQADTGLAIPDGATKLPYDQPIAIYYRQSTEAQVGNVSTSIQTVDMVAHLKRLGWPEDRIVLIDMDEGVSGSKRIDERVGMSQLFGLIVDEQIGAAACQDEDRLFRDVTQIQVNIFIDACKKSKVLVLTPSMVYDFANPVTGSFHARQFRFKCEMAAEYISSYIRGRLHQARRRLLLEGRWAGAGIPPGYMVDMRRILPEGSKNDHWRRLVPFPPYADVVNEYFRLFLKNAGNLRATVRYIQEHGPWYPDPANCKPPEDFKALYRMHRYGKGFCPGRVGLHELLTNAVYIGHWAVNDAIVRWNNHPALVPHDVFMRAYNYRSDVTIDEKPNREYRPFQEHGRPSKEIHRSVDRPLCSGIIVSKDEDKWRKVGTNWVVPLQHYTYVLLGAQATDEYRWSKRASDVDDVVSTLLHEKLLATFDPAVWQRSLSALEENTDSERKNLLAQLTALEKVMENQIASLDSLTEPELIRAVQERYKDAKAEHARRCHEVATLENKTRQVEAILALRENCGPALDNWPRLTRDEKRVLLHAFIDRIEASPIENHGLQIVIRWRDASSDGATLPHRGGKGFHWLPAEIEHLLQAVDQGTTALEIAANCPDRTWGAIDIKIRSLRGCGPVRRKYNTIRDIETYNQYLERVGNGSQAVMNSVTRSGTNVRSHTSAFMLSSLIHGLILNGHSQERRPAKILFTNLVRANIRSSVSPYHLHVSLLWPLIRTKNSAARLCLIGPFRVPRYLDGRLVIDCPCPKSQTDLNRNATSRLCW